MSVTVGILGGMGPYATVEFFKKILDMTPATKDWHHLRLIIDNNPQIPSRTRHFLYCEESPVQGMIDSCQRLASYPVDFIVLPCNSACYYLNEVAPHVPVPIINIITVAANALANKYPAVRRCSVLGGQITHAARTYETPLMEHGIEYLPHSDDVQAQVEQLIERIKLNDDKPAIEKTFDALVKKLKKEMQTEAIVLGCTEFGCINHTMLDVAVVDSSQELASFVITKARTMKLS